MRNGVYIPCTSNAQMEQHMKNLMLGFGAIAIFVVGGFVGGQIIDRNQSIYIKVDLGDIGEILLGKQLDLIDLASWEIEDKLILIAGIENLLPDDRLSGAILELEKTGTGLFTPKQFEVKVHVTNDPKLNNDRASICESNTADFYTKALTIFDTQPNSEANGMIQVGAWDKSDSALCLDPDSRHIWVHLDTANKLYPDNSNPISDGSELDLSGRVSNSCKIPQEIS
jgi:hypothetical protein